VIHRLALLAPGLAALAGCAPSAAYFVEHHRYDEAMCAVEKGKGDEDAARRLVAAAIARDLAPSLHVHAVTRAELEASIGAAGARVADRVLLLDVTLDAQKPQGVEGTFALSLRGSGVKAPAGGKDPAGTGVALARRELFAALVDETLPQQRQVVHAPNAADKIDAALSSPGGFLAGLGELVTLGLVPVTEITGVVKTRVTTIDPTDADYAKKAPAAETLYQSFQNRRGRPFAFARPEGDDVRLHVHIELRTHVGSCSLAVEADVALPKEGSDASIEDRINRRFASRRMVRLSELGEVVPATGP
jgi:hypothetical protein